MMKTTVFNKSKTRAQDRYPNFPISLFIVLTFSSSILATCSFGQLKLVPLPKEIKSPVTKKTSEARTKATTLLLPFFDDFSSYPSNQNGTPKGPLWINSKSVTINSGMGINSPSINVATFDGLDSVNLPYEPSQILLNGLTDKLVSDSINLSSDVLPVDQRNSVFISFYYQWQGNGEAPDASDYLQLEFKNVNKTWVSIQTFTGGETPDNTVFNYFIAKVDGESFFHKSFQFRLVRYGRKSGPYDTWNVDYIYLNSGRSASENSFEDIAAASTLSSLFKPYRAVPIKHFFIQKHLDSVRFDVKNLRNTKTAVSYEAIAKFKNYYTEPTPTQVFEKTLVTGGVISNGLMDPFATAQTRLSNLPDPNDTLQFDTLATKIEVRIKIKVVSGDVLGTFPADLSVNDTVSSVYKLEDYYAYDDGVAEYALTLTNPGNIAAVMFEPLTPEKVSLKAFDIYFPDYAITSNLTSDFFVYDDLDGIPGKVISRSTRYSIQPKGLNVFTRVRVPAVDVQGKFYIAWSEPSAETVKVGLDLNHDNGNKIFTKTGGPWKQNTLLKGSLMIRPVFGEATLITGVESPPEKKYLSLYPNPNAGTFFIGGHYDEILVTNVMGQPVDFLIEESGEEKRITMQSAAQGLYLVQLRVGDSTEVRKMLVR